MPITVEGQPISDADIQGIYNKLGIDTNKPLSDADITKITDEVVSYVGGDSAAITKTLQSWAANRIPLTEENFARLLNGDAAYVPPPDLAAANPPSHVNEFFTASFNTAMVEIAMTLIDMLKENDIVMGEKAVENLANMFSLAFARAENEIQLGNDQAAKDIAEGIAGIVSGLANLAAAGASIYTARATAKETETQLKPFTDKEKDLQTNWKTNPANDARSGEAPLSQAQKNDKLYEVQSKISEIKLGEASRVQAKTAIFSQLANAVEGASKAYVGFTNASYDKDMGQLRAENVILETAQKAAEQAWNKALDNLYKSNPQDRDAMANFLKEVLAASARIGTTSA